MAGITTHAGMAGITDDAEPMSEFVYEVLAEQVPRYPNQPLIVRTREPARLPAALATEDPESIVGARLLSVDADSEPLHAWAPGLPLELVIDDPATEFPLLYRHAHLLENHPVRVAIAVRPGFAKAVRLAVALDFAVRLEVGQPEPALIEELREVLGFYLRQPTVAQPVEFFHGALLGFFHEEPVPLWVVLDENPQYQRQVDDDGTEDLQGRLAGTGIALAADAGLDEWMEQALATHEDCRRCEFLEICGGYFKWPRRDYDCAGVKQLFDELREAAAELRHDLSQA
jgi:hypothetical protein